MINLIFALVALVCEFTLCGLTGEMLMKLQSPASPTCQAGVLYLGREIISNGKNFLWKVQFKHVQ